MVPPRPPKLRVVGAAPDGDETSVDAILNVHECGPAAVQVADTLTRAATAASCIVSLLLHVAIGIWLAVGAEPDGIGAGGVDLEAVSLEVIEASELQPAAVASASHEGNADETREAIAELVPKPEIVLATRPPEALLPPDPPSAAEPDIAAAAKQAETVEAVPEEQPKEQLPDDPKRVDGTADIRQSGQDATAAGGLVTDATAATTAAQAATSAAAGELRQYALAVRLAIGKARPRHTGARGKVVVVFTVGEDGRVQSPSIARSSGDARLDAEALAAIARASLPPPPAGATAQQRTFLIPFDFR